MLAEAKSEVRKQECRAEFLDSFVRDSDILTKAIDGKTLDKHLLTMGFVEVSASKVHK